MGLLALPPELILLVIAQLPVSDVVALRALSRHIRSLVLASPPSLPAARRALLALHDRVASSPASRSARRTITPHLRSFDRTTWLVELKEAIDLAQANFGSKAGGTLAGTAIPEELEIWVRECPEHAITSWVWPGLPVCSWASMAPSGWAYASMEDWCGLVQNTLGAAKPVVRKYRLIEGYQGYEDEGEESEDEEGRTLALEVRNHGRGIATVVVVQATPKRQHLVGTVHVARGEAIIVQPQMANWMAFLETEFDVLARTHAHRQA